MLRDPASSPDSYTFLLLPSLLSGPPWHRHLPGGAVRNSLVRRRPVLPTQTARGRNARRPRVLPGWRPSVTSRSVPRISSGGVRDAQDTRFCTIRCHRLSVTSCFLPPPGPKIFRKSPQRAPKRRTTVVLLVPDPTGEATASPALLRTRFLHPVSQAPAQCTPRVEQVNPRAPSSVRAMLAESPQRHQTLRANDPPAPHRSTAHREAWAWSGSARWASSAPA